MHEPEDHVLMLLQTDEKIEGVTFLWGPFFARGFLWGRVGFHSSLDEFGVTAFKVLLRRLGQARLSLLPRLLNTGFDF
jgi:hypothetical protein